MFTFIYPVVAGKKEVLVLTPVMNDLRGDIMSSSGARMNTLLHLGEARASARELMAAEAPQLSAVTLVTVPLMTLSIFLYSLLFGEAIRIEMLYLVAIVASLAATVILFPYLSVAIAEIFKRGREPSNLIPTLATVGGDLISFPLLVLSFLLTSLLPERLRPPAFLLALSLSIALSVALLLLYRRARRVLAERAAIIGFLLLLQPIAGVLLAALEESLAERGLIQMAVSFIGMIGALSSIVGLRLSVHLHLYGPAGLRTSFLEAAIDVALSSLPASLVLASAGYAFQRLFYGDAMVGIAPLMLTIATAMILAVALGALVAAIVSIVAYRAGLDPDNVAVPAITTVMDSVGMLILYLASEIFI